MSMGMMAAGNTNSLPRVSNGVVPRTTNTALMELLRKVKPQLEHNVRYYSELRVLESAICRLEFALKVCLWIY